MRYLVYTQVVNCDAHLTLTELKQRRRSVVARE